MRLKSTFLAAILIAAPQLSASVIVYTATLSGANEVPPNNSTGFGFSLVTLNGDMLTVHETFSGLIGGPAAAAHIHCCGPIGVNEPVAVPFVGFPALTSGTYDHVFDLTLSATYTTGFVTSSGGTAALAEAALIAGLSSGQAYANIHDALFPGGEIRGQLAPEPATWGLTGLAFTGLVLFGRKRRIWA